MNLPAPAVDYTSSGVLLVLVLALGSAWIRDRNARLRDMRDQVTEWREAHRLSEKARETQAEIAREALEIARTSEAVINGLRAAVSQSNQGPPI